MSARLSANEEPKRPNDCMFLTKDELNDLTGRRQRGSQAEALRAMGIEHKVRPDGHIVVLRRHVEQIFGAGAERRSTGEAVPNWSAA